MAVVPCVAGLLIATGPGPAEAASQGQLRVTARVVNRCTIELPPPARWDVPPGLLRRSVRHGCDVPVRPRLTLQRMGERIRQPDVGWLRHDRYFLVTITY